MLTRLRIRNFKRFDDIDIDLGSATVLIGPNNSGKTTALQALALWNIGVRRWLEKRGGKASPEKRPVVTINRRDLIALPVPLASLLWRGLHVRNVEQVETNGRKKPKTENIRIDVIVDGVTEGHAWSCGIEFDYANEESLYCRPLREEEGSTVTRMNVPPAAGDVRIAFLPPMSGLAAVEPKWEPGRVNVLIGEGQTAQVLRNLCYQIQSQADSQNDWQALVKAIRSLFGVELLSPEFSVERGEITMAYEERDGTHLDLSSSGRGLQQTLLLLAHLYANPRTVLLLDEPDAHLEILRQRQIYNLLKETAEKQGSQIIAASHSEVVLNEAAERDVVVAFVGRPHRLDDRSSQVLKALNEIGFEHYYQAEQTGWVLYLEGSTDLAILQAFAATLGHEAAASLKEPFVHYVGNQPDAVRRHFHGLREAKRDLVGVALFDRLERDLPDDLGAAGLSWKRREIENYLCLPSVLRAYARHDLDDDLFGQAEADKRVKLMDTLIHDQMPPVALRDAGHAWWVDTKATDAFLDPLFATYFDRLGLPNLVRKRDYHQLATLIPPDEVDPEVREKLDAIVAVARQAKPRQD
ncbi:MAG: AAA family ATPase [Phycisphaerae bacterium]|jgi:predicted ATPase